MALPKQTSRDELIRKLKRLGFVGPISGTRHAMMRRGTLTLRIPNPHGTDIRIGLLRTILRQAAITDDEWNDA
jgi:predicted RNA binding protein YcfA (HicA-like mRNA interferase family)